MCNWFFFSHKIFNPATVSTLADRYTVEVTNYKLETSKPFLNTIQCKIGKDNKKMKLCAIIIGFCILISSVQGLSWQSKGQRLIDKSLKRLLSHNSQTGTSIVEYCKTHINKGEIYILCVTHCIPFWFVKISHD